MKHFDASNSLGHSRLLPDRDGSGPHCGSGTADFLGVDFTLWTAEETEAWLRARDAASPFAYVVTPNVDHMVRLQSAEPEVRRAYAAADVILCDSRILSKLAALAGVRLTVVPGSDLTAALFGTILGPGDRVCLVGGHAGDAERLRTRYPGVIVDQHVAPMGLRRDAAARSRAVDAAVAARARVTLFAVGSPQQELLAREMAGRPGASGTALCVGASTDFLVGAKIRAPRIVQKLSLEWAWRLLSSPRQMARRYLVDGPGIFLITWRWARARRRQD